MLRRYVVVLHGLCELLGTSEHAHHIHPHAKAVRAVYARDGGELLLQTSLEHRQIHAAGLKDRCEQPLGLFGQCEQHMCRRDFLMIAHRRNLLCRLKRRQRPCSIFILFHRYPSTVPILCVYYNR